MRTANVRVQLDGYVVYTYDGTSSRQGIYRGITRYFTDDTLPYEIKWKLGMVMFGSRDETVGHKVAVLSDTYYLHITPETFDIIMGERHDPRSESQSESETGAE